MDENKTEIQSLIRKDKIFEDVRIKDGYVHFEFSEFEFSGRSQDCVVYSWVEIPGQMEDGLTQRLNLLSGSARTDFVRQLQNSFGKIANWSLIFSQVCARVLIDLEHSREAKKFSDFEYQPTIRVLGHFLEDQGVNVFFGMGGSGKTYIALEMALAVALGHEFLGIKAEKTGNVLFVDYEDNHQTFYDRISLLCADRNIDPAELDKRLFYYKPQGLPIHNLRFSLQKEITSKQITLMIVDSAALACGGEPESAQVATQLFNALNALNICILLIGHKTKAEDSDKYPFGSIFFYNSPRNIWYVKKDQDLGENVIYAGLIHRKSNHGKQSVPYSLKIEFLPVQVKITQESNKRWGEDLSLKERILNSLEEGPKTVEELSKDLALAKDRVKPRLSELQNLGKIKPTSYGGKWQIFYPKEIEI